MTPKEQQALDAFWRAVWAGRDCGAGALGASLGWSGGAAHSALKRLRRRGLIPPREASSNDTPAEWRQQVPPEYRDPGFTLPDLPSSLPTVPEIIARRKAEYARNSDAEDARQLVPVKVTLDGPIGIAHLGDPHIDDPGTDIATLEEHVRIIRDTPGLFAANVGDSSNNWTGRLARLHGGQSTSEQEAWLLVEWLVKSAPWLYLIAGNHDLWAGAGDPIKWMLQGAKALYEPYGVRLALIFPNRKVVRVNARHDFAGKSMWNPAHGPMKAAQAGWRDHILTAGHRHISGHGVVKCPASGLISHCMLVAGYKRIDNYAKAEGFPDQRVSPAFVTVIDPRWDDSDPRLVTTLYDVETGADYLTWLRSR